MTDNKVNIQCNVGVLQHIGAIGLNKFDQDQCVIQQIKKEVKEKSKIKTLIKKAKNKIGGYKAENYIDMDEKCTSFKEGFTNSTFKKSLVDNFNKNCKGKKSCEIYLNIEELSTSCKMELTKRISAPSFMMKSK